MNKICLFQNLLFSGAFCTIFSIPVGYTQAAIIGEFQFRGGVSNFFESVEPGLDELGNPNEFEVIFNMFGDFIAGTNTSGIFAESEGGPLPDSDINNLSFLSALNGRPDREEEDPIVGNFRWIETTLNRGDRYELVEPIIFDFFDSSEIGVSEVAIEDRVRVVYEAGSTFLGSIDDDRGGSYSFVPDSVRAEVSLPPNLLFSSSFVIESLSFSDLPGNGDSTSSYIGELEISDSLPEPSIIFGLLSFCGLAFVLKYRN